MSKIDDLYKRAFGTGSYSYEDVNWDKMESLLDDSLPVSTTSYWLGKAASFTLVAGITLMGVLFNAPTELLVPEAKNLFSENIEPVEKQQDNAEMAGDAQLENRTSTSENRFTEEGKVETLEENQTTNLSKPNTPLKAVRNGVLTAKLQKTSIPATGQNQKSNSLLRIVKDNIPEKTLVGLNAIAATETNNKELIKPTEEIINPARSFTSLEFMKSPSFQLGEDDINLMAFDFKKNKAKTKLKGSPQLFVGLRFISERLDNDEDLNINVSEEIKNVALVDLKNNSNAAGINFGLKWKGLVVNSGILYKQQASKYNIYYSHTNNWDEQSINSETTLTDVNRTYLGYEMSTYEKDGKTHWLRTPIYQDDSVFQTTTDTSYTAHSNTQELDEKFGYKINYVSIPLTVGYEHQVNRFFVSVNIGMNMDVLSTVSGNIYNANSNRVLAFNDKKDLNPIVYSANAAIGVGYDISPQLSFTIQPRVSKSLNSTFKEDSDFATTYQSVGANFMLRYNF